MYSNKKYAPVAWQPLRDWVWVKDPTKSLARRERLMSFNKEDKVFHSVVAKCLWRLASGANLPWGRAGVHSCGYSEIPISEKVVFFEYPHDWRQGYTCLLVVRFFFLVIENEHDHMWTSCLGHTPTMPICVRVGLGFRVWSAMCSWSDTPHELGRLSMWRVVHA